jgi:hypothetical protein
VYALAEALAEGGPAFLTNGVAAHPQGGEVVQVRRPGKAEGTLIADAVPG